MAGRRTKLTQQTTERVCEAIRKGATYDLACQYAGISTSAFYLWLKRGEEEEDGIHAEFLDAVKAADADCAIKDLDAITTARNEGTWQAAAWRLERRHGYRAQSEQRVHVEADPVDREKLKERLKSALGVDGGPDSDGA